MPLPHAKYLTPADHAWLRPFRGDVAGEWAPGHLEAAHAAWWQIQGAHAVSFHGPDGTVLAQVDIDDPTPPTWQAPADWTFGDPVYAVIRDVDGAVMQQAAAQELAPLAQYTLVWSQVEEN